MSLLIPMVFLCLSIYPYFLFPVVLGLFPRRWGRIGYPFDPVSDPVPAYTVSILLSVFNEEKVVGRKIRNFLEQVHFPGRAELLILSDGSTDKTNEIVREYAGNFPDRIKFRLSDRQGKTSALNRLASMATGEILIFTDANAYFRPDAVLNLLKPFGDPRVGLASGQTIYYPADADKKRNVLGFHEKLEMRIRSGESTTGNLVSADGAIYAMRKSIFSPLANDNINDLYHPFETVSKGYRSVFVGDANCDEEQPPTWTDELRRQRRICAQSFFVMNRIIPSSLFLGKHLFLLFIVSHKYLRLFSFPLFCLSILFVALEISPGLFYLLALALSMSAYLFYAGKFDYGRKIFNNPLARSALIACHFFFGVIDSIRGDRKVIWNVRGDK